MMHWSVQVAALIKNECHACVGELLGRDYYLHDDVTADFSFWSAVNGRSAPAAESMPVAQFVAAPPGLGKTDLLQADLLALLASLLRPGQQPWRPWLVLNAAACPPLPLFRRSRGASGMANLRLCLGLEAAADGGQIRQRVDARLAELAAAEPETIVKSDLSQYLNLKNWHDPSAS